MENKKQSKISLKIQINYPKWKIKFPQNSPKKFYPKNKVK